MNLLYFTREPHPTFRVDITVLFGKYLPRYRINSDLVAMASEIGQVNQTWTAGDTFLCPRAGSRAQNAMRPFFHAFAVLWRARNRAYGAYQVRDNALQALVVLMAARLRRLPFFYWMSFPIVESNLELAREGARRIGLVRYLFALAKGHVGKHILYGLVLPGADHVFVQSDRMAADMAARGVNRKKMTAVPMGVDLEAANPDDIRPSDDPRLAGKRIVVYLGTLERARRIDLLFEMLAIARHQMPDILLVLAGDTSDAGHRAWLLDRMRALGVEEQVLWTGWLPMPEAWRYVRAAEVGLSPIPRSSLLDCGSPTKAIEYMALGLPVLANDQPDQLQVLAGSGAGVCVPLSPEGFAGALVDMLNSPEKLSQWREAGRPYVGLHRSYKAISENLAGVYHGLMPHKA